MQDKKAQALAFLNSIGAAYTLYEHEAVFTMDDLAAHGVGDKALVAKNLFLRDHKGKRHFLIVVAGDKPVDLKHFGQQIGSRVSFASAERLARYLNLVAGEVTPLGLLFDEGRNVEVYLDRDFVGRDDIGLHPCVNTATVVLDYDTLRRIVEMKAKSCELMDIPE